MTPESRRPSRRWLAVVALAVLAGAAWWAMERRRRPPVPPDRIVSLRTCAVERERVRRDDRERVIIPGLARLREAMETGALAAAAGDPGRRQEWERLLWTMTWSDYREPEGVAPLRALLDIPAVAGETRRRLFETIAALYPREFAGAMEAALDRETDDRLWSMAAACVLRADPAKGDDVVERLRSRFPAWPDLPRLRAVAERVAHAKAGAPPPDLRRLLRHPFPGGGPVVFSVQRPDRGLIGRAMVRLNSGHFWRPEGTLFSVPQFARSVSDLPGHLTHGNTPQGVFQIRAIEVCSSPAIGPTEALILGLPDEYAGPPAVGTPHFTTMRGLVPPEWEAWPPFLEAEWAGLAKRTEILAHGTTIDPENWRQRAFHPYTPSLGCLTCPEEWHPATGERMASAQQALVDAVRAGGGPPGWLVVVETAPQATPVSPGELEALTAGLD